MQIQETKKNKIIEELETKCKEYENQIRKFQITGITAEFDEHFYTPVVYNSHKQQTEVTNTPLLRYILLILLKAICDQEDDDILCITFSPYAYNGRA